MVNVEQKGEYLNLDVKSLLPNEVVEMTLTKNPYFGEGQYGRFAIVTGTLSDGREVSFFVNHSMLGRSKKLIEEVEELKEGDNILISKITRTSKKTGRTYNIYQVVRNETFKQASEKAQQTQTTEKPRLALGLKKVLKSKYSPEEEDMIRQLVAALGMQEFSDEDLIQGVISGFKEAGKEYSKEQAEKLLEEAKRRL